MAGSVDSDIFCTLSHWSPPYSSRQAGHYYPYFTVGEVDIRWIR